MKRRAQSRSSKRTQSSESLETRALLSTITVTSIADNTDTDGEVTLREAIQAANTDQSVDGSTAGDGADTIVFDPSLTGMIELTGHIEITESVTVEGQGRTQTVLRSPEGVFYVAQATANVDLSIDGLKIIKSRNAIEHIGDGGSLTVRDSRFARNRRVILSNVDLLVVNSEFYKNRRGQTGGAILAVGAQSGGIDVTIKRSEFTENYTTNFGAPGGAVAIRGAIADISSSFFGDNESGRSGGALSLTDSEATVTNTTFTGNSTRYFGGAIYVSESGVEVLQSTLVNNTASSSSGGGGIYAYRSDVFTQNTVFYRNLARITLQDIYQGFRSSVSAEHSFISSNSSSGLTANGGTADADGNLIGTSSAPLDPLLAAVADNGGPTKSRLPLPTSPLVDAGTAPTTISDQRGTNFPRTAGAGTDIGAVEFVDVAFGVTPSRHIVNEADANLTVTFDVTLRSDTASAFDLSVTGAGSATAGTDYTAINETLSFAGTAGETHQFSVTVLDDAQFEFDEELTFDFTTTLADTVAGFSPASVAIISDETTGLGVSGGTLIAFGDGADDTLTVVPSGADITATLNGEQLTAPAASINAAKIVLGDGANSVAIDSTLHIDADVTAGDGNDTIVTGTGADTIFTGGGDDEITTNGGHDSVHAGSGDDTILGGDGSDTLDGAGGSDSIAGEGGTDLLLGRQGRDTIEGGNGNDTVYGGASGDVIDGGDLDDMLYGHSDVDVYPMLGEDGNDVITGGSGEDTLLGGSGIDRIDGGADDDYAHASGTLKGGDGHDQLVAVLTGPASRLVGGMGEDTITGSNADDTLIGGEGHDTIRGGKGDDLIEGNGGRDSIAGNDGADEIHGGVKRDTLWGEQGYDTIYGDAGPDKIVGHIGNDVLVGGLDDDTISGNADHDLILGGEGLDVLTGEDGHDVIIGGNGADSISGNDNTDLLISGSTTLSLSDLELARDEWKAEERTAEVRKANLTDGTGSATRNNGSVFLLDTGVGANIMDDGEIDIVQGNNDRDWFFINLGQDDSDTDLF